MIGVTTVEAPGTPNWLGDDVVIVVSDCPDTERVFDGADVDTVRVVVGADIDVVVKEPELRLAKTKGLVVVF